MCSKEVNVLGNKDVQRIILTGGAGFIGSNVALALNQIGYLNIVIVDHLNNKFKEENLKDLKYSKYLDRIEFLNLIKTNSISEIDTILHFGACTKTTNADKDFMLEMNTEYSKVLFDYCVQNQLNFIYASSASTYGDGSKGFSDKERNLKPLNYYGYSKYLFDEYVLNSKLKPKQWAGLKFFNVYGCNEFHKGFMASMVLQGYNQAVNNNEIKLFKASKEGYKDGLEKRDFVYVKDVVKVVLFFLENKISGIFNLGTGKARSFLDLSEAIFKSLNKKTKISFCEMPQDIKDKYQYFTQADITSLREAWYLDSFYELEDGVSDYIQNYLMKTRIKESVV